MTAPLTTLHIHPADTVLVALRDLPPGTVVPHGGGELTLSLRLEFTLPRLAGHQMIALG